MYHILVQCEPSTENPDGLVVDNPKPLDHDDAIDWAAEIIREGKYKPIIVGSPDPVPDTNMNRHESGSI